MRIANPMYDAAFKYLMDDQAAARLLVGAVLGEEVDQELRAPGERHVLEVDEREIPRRYAPVLRRLEGAAASEEVFSVGSRVGSVAAGCAAILISVEGVVMGGYSLLVKRAERRGEQRGERRGRNEERRRMERWREEQVEAGFVYREDLRTEARGAGDGGAGGEAGTLGGADVNRRGSMGAGGRGPG